MSKRMRAHIFLTITAFLWGAAFVAQKESMLYIGPFTFTGVRMIIGGAALVPLILILGKGKFVPESDSPRIPGIAGYPSLVGGFFCGTVLFFAITIQQIGLVYTTAGKAGFITALYIIIVPILGLFMKKRVSKLIWLCVLIALVGMYLLCLQEQLTVNKGDLIVLFSTLGFAIHIITVDYFSPKGDPIKISCVQFFVCGFLCIPMLIVEVPTIAALMQAWLPIFYASFISCGVAYTLQVVAQRDTAPTITALILSLESVFAVLMGFLLLNELLTLKEVAGCVLMFTAIILAQMPDKKGELK